MHEVFEKTGIDHRAKRQGPPLVKYPASVSHQQDLRLDNVPIRVTVNSRPTTQVRCLGCSATNMPTARAAEAASIASASSAGSFAADPGEDEGMAGVDGDHAQRAG